MNKRIKLLGCLLLLGLYTAVQADTLENERIDTVKQYINALQSANTSQMLGLFAPGSVVVSTSKGRVAPDQFFPGFFAEIQSATTSINAIYKSADDEGKYSASFAFSWKLKDGEAGGGHYVDEFVFVENSHQLQMVYMYENMKFD